MKMYRVIVVTLPLESGEILLDSDKMFASKRELNNWAKKEMAKRKDVTVYAYCIKACLN